MPTLDFSYLNAGATPSTDYTQGSGRQTLRDPRFLADLRAQANARGWDPNTSDEDLIHYFFNEQRARQANTVSAVAGAIQPSMWDQEGQRRMARIDQVFNNQPWIWELPWGEMGTGLGQYAFHGAWDPLNLIPGARAATAARAAATTAAAAGKNALMAGVSRGAIAGATSEAGINAAASAISSTAEQFRESSLGTGNGFSFGRLAAETAIGTGVGAGIGGVIGAGTGGVVARSGEQLAGSLTAGGFSPEQVARLTPSRVESLSATNRQGGALPTPQQEFPGDYPAPPAPAPALTPQQLQDERLAQESEFLNDAHRAAMNDLASRRVDLLADQNDVTRRAEAQEEYDAAQRRAELIETLQAFRPLYDRAREQFALQRSDPNPDVRATATQRSRSLREIGTMYDLAISREDPDLFNQVIADWDNLLQSEPAFQQALAAQKAAQQAATQPQQAAPTGAAPEPGADPAAAPAAEAPTSAPSSAVPPASTSTAPTATDALPQPAAQPAEGVQTAQGNAPNAPAAPTDPNAAPGAVQPEAAPPPRVYSKPVRKKAVELGVDLEELAASLPPEQKITAKDVVDFASKQKAPSARAADLEERWVKIYQQIEASLGPQSTREQWDTFLKDRDAWRQIFKSFDPDAAEDLMTLHETALKSSTENMRLNKDSEVKLREAAIAERMKEILRQNPKLGPIEAREVAVRQLDEFINNAGPETTTRSRPDRTIYSTAGTSTPKREMNKATGETYYTPSRVSSILKQGLTFNKGEDGEYSIIGSAIQTKKRAGSIRDDIIQIPDNRTMGLAEAVAYGRSEMRTAAAANESLMRRIEASARMQADAEYAKKQGWDPAEKNTPGARTRDIADPKGDAAWRNTPEYIRMYQEAHQRANKAIQPQDARAIVAYRTKHDQPIRGGLIKRGETVYVDTASGKPYRSIEDIYRSRGLTAEQARQAAADTTYASIERGKEKGGATQTSTVAPEARPAPQALDDSFEGVLAQLKSGNVDIKALTERLLKRGEEPKPSSPVQAAQDIPLTKDGMKIIIRHKETGLTRTPTAKQIESGYSVERLMGKTPADKWDISYVPIDTPTNPSTAAKAFTKAKTVEATVGGVPPVEVTTPRAIAVDYDVFANQRIDLKDLGDTMLDDLVHAAMFARDLLGLKGDLDATRQEFLTNGISGDELVMINHRINHANWQTGRKAEAVVNGIRATSAIIARYAPGGIAMKTQDAAAARAQLLELSKKVTPEDAALMLRAHDAIIGGGRAPVYAAADEYGTTTTFVTGVPVKVKVGPTKNVGHVPLAHELFHYGWNFLTPEDQARLMEITYAKFIDEQGNLRRQTLSEMSPPPGAVPNAHASPMEYLANQYALFISGKIELTPAEQTLFQKIAKLIREAWDWFINAKAADPDLVPLFSKMMAPEDRAPFTGKVGDSRPDVVKNWRNMDLEALSEFVPENRQGMLRVIKELQANVDGIRRDWEAAMPSALGGSYDTLIDTAWNTLSYFNRAFPLTKEKAPSEWRPQYKKDGTLANDRRNLTYAIGRRVRNDLYQILSGRSTKGEGDTSRLTDADMATLKENLSVIDPRRMETIVNQLMQLYHDGHHISSKALSQEEIAARQGGVDPGALAAGFEARGADVSNLLDAEGGVDVGKLFDQIMAEGQATGPTPSGYTGSRTGTPGSTWTSLDYVLSMMDNQLDISFKIATGDPRNKPPKKRPERDPNVYQVGHFKQLKSRDVLVGTNELRGQWMVDSIDTLPDGSPIAMLVRISDGMKFPLTNDNSQRFSRQKAVDAPTVSEVRTKAHNEIRTEVKAQEAKVEKAVQQAKSVASTPKKGRDAKVGGQILSSESTGLLKNYMNGDINQLISDFAHPKNKGTPHETALAYAIVRRTRAMAANAKIVEPGWMTPETKASLLRMSGAELEAAHLNAIDANDMKGFHATRWEIQRREQTNPKIKASTERMVLAIAREIDESVSGLDDGIPGGADPTVQAALRSMTHRDPMVQATTRTLGYRLFNLLAGDERRPITYGDVSLLSGSSSVYKDPAAPVAGPSPELNNYRTSLRRLAAGLEKGTETAPRDVIAQVAKMASQTIPRLAGDADGEIRAAHAKAKVSGRLGADMAGPSEWFANTMADYFAMRLTRAQVGEFLDAGLLDEMADRSAYLINGLVGRQDVANQYPRLMHYGDMFERVGKELPVLTQIYGPVASVPASSAASYGREIKMRAGERWHESATAYIADGLGQIDGQPRFFYHGTPYSGLRPENPNVEMRPGNGINGKGVYLTDNPQIADLIYSKDVRRETLYNAVDQFQTSDIAKHFEVQEIVEQLDVARRGLAEARQTLSESELTRRRYKDPEVIQQTEQARKQVESLEKMVAASYRRLNALGVPIEPYVVPTLVRVQNPVDFSRSFDVMNDPFISAIVREAETLKPGMGRRIMSGVNDLAEDGRIPGEELSIIIREEFEDTLGVDPNTTFQKMGYDAIVWAYENLLTDADGVSIPVKHTGVIVFDPKNVKHADSDYFHVGSPRLYDIDNELGNLPGALIRAAMSTDETPGSFEPMASTSNMKLMDNRITQAIKSITSKKEPTPEELINLRDIANVQISSNGRHLRERLGMNWLADKTETLDVAVAQQASQILLGKGNQKGLLTMLRELPGAESMAKRYARKASGNLYGAQPESHTKIWNALIRPSGSDQERNLAPREREVYNAVRGQMQGMLRRLRESGLMIGDLGPDYFPQVWDTDLIAKKRPEAIEAFTKYFKAENPTRTDEEARTKAIDIVTNMIVEENNGIIIDRMGSTRSPSASHADYARVIRLDRHPDLVKELSPFMEKNLESSLVRYFDTMSRKQVFTERFGMLNQGFYDYQVAAVDGIEGIAKLLSTNRIIRRPQRTVSPLGEIADVNLEANIPMPFSNREMEALEFAKELAAIQATSGPAAVREKLMQLSDPDPVTKTHEKAYLARVDAIVGALKDHGGSPVTLSGRADAWLENLMRQAMRKPMHGQTQTALHNFSRAARAFNSVTLLGFTVLSSFGDTVLPLVRSGEFKAATKAWAKFASDPDYRNMIRNVGVAWETIVSDAMMAAQGSGWNRAQNAFFHLNGLTPWTKLQREAAGAVGYESLKVMQAKTMRGWDATKPLHEQQPEVRRAGLFLKRHGLDESYMNGTHILGNMAEDTSDPKIREAIVRFADSAIFQPTPNDTPQWAATPIGSLVYQLKSFPVMMGRLVREVAEQDIRDGNYKRLAIMATVLPAVGGLSLATKDYIQSRGGEENQEMALRDRGFYQWLTGDGKEPPKDDFDRYMGWYVESAMQAGGLGLLASLIHDVTAQVDNGAYGAQRIVSAIMGPTAGLLFNSVPNVAGGIYEVASDMVEDDGSNSKERLAMRELVGRAPLIGQHTAAREWIVNKMAGEGQR